MQFDRDGIGPTSSFDDDGKVYYTRQWSAANMVGCGMQSLNLETGKLEGELGELVAWHWRGKLARRATSLQGYRTVLPQMLASEGGTGYNHSRPHDGAQRTRHGGLTKPILRTDPHARHPEG